MNRVKSNKPKAGAVLEDIIDGTSQKVKSNSIYFYPKIKTKAKRNSPKVVKLNKETVFSEIILSAKMKPVKEKKIKSQKNVVAVRRITVQDL
tara:strand:- start:520 stop:795 length:276 start_codon:yes stop_codon:yes gene_type:complete